MTTVEHTDAVAIPEPPAEVAGVLNRWQDALAAGAEFIPDAGDPVPIQAKNLTARHLGRAMEIHLQNTKPDGQPPVGAREVIRLGRFRVDIVAGRDVYSLIADAPGAHVSVKVPADAWILVYPC